MRHVIVYSHGFGVDRTDRGLFSDIARSFPNTEQVMFDYNDTDKKNNSMTINSLQDQAKRLQEHLESIKANDDTIIDLVAHSQGCVVAALVGAENIRNIVCIAPPSNLDVDSMIMYFGSRDGAKIDVTGTSVIPRRDGSRTIINANYWNGVRSLSVIDLYARLASVSRVSFYIANNDEVLGSTDFNDIDPRIDLIRINGDHDFNKIYRTKLCQLVKERLIRT